MSSLAVKSNITYLQFVKIQGHGCLDESAFGQATCRWNSQQTSPPLAAFPSVSSTSTSLSSPLPGWTMSMSMSMSTYVDVHNPPAFAFAFAFARDLLTTRSSCKRCPLLSWWRSSRACAAAAKERTNAWRPDAPIDCTVDADAGPCLPLSLQKKEKLATPQVVNFNFILILILTCQMGILPLHLSVCWLKARHAPDIVKST